MEFFTNKKDYSSDADVVMDAQFVNGLYDFDVTSMIDTSRPLKFEDLGLKLPDAPPTQVFCPSLF